MRPWNRKVEMIIHMSSSVLALILFVPPAFGQLHLLTGSPYSAGQAVYPSAILRVESDGTVRRIQDIARPPVGTEWIGVSYEWRRAVLLGSWEDSITVVNLDTATIAKSCKPPDPSGRIYMDSWLADDPGMGPSFEWLEAG